MLVVEDGGKPLIGFLKQTHPFRPEKCWYRDAQCVVEKSKDCAKQSVIYEITCKQCTEPVDPTVEVDSRSRELGQQARYQYIGMTCMSVHARMVDH